MFAEPLSSEQQPATQQHQAPAMTHDPSEVRASEEVQASDATHNFPSEHQMHNTAPADDEQSMFGEPLTSHAPEASGFRCPQGQAAPAASPDSSPSGGHLPGGYEFASQHRVSNRAPHDEQAYAQPLSSDRQEDRFESAQRSQRDSSSSTHDAATQHVVSSQASAGERPQAQPLQSGQQRNTHPSTEPAASFASQHNMQNEAPPEQSRYAQPLVHDEARHGPRTAAQTSGSSPDQQGEDFVSQHTMRNEAPVEQSRYAQPLVHDEARHGSYTAAQTSSGAPDQQEFAWRHSLQNEPPPEETSYAEPLTSHQHEDGAEPFPANRGASTGDRQAFPSQHSMHNAAPAGESMYGQALTSEQHTRTSEHGTGLLHPSDQGRSHSGGQFTLDDPNFAPELDREAPAIQQQQQPFHAQPRQAGYGFQQPQTHGEDEGAEKQERGGEGENVQGQHSNAEQLHASQHPNEQQYHQRLTGSANGERFAAYQMFSNLRLPKQCTITSSCTSVLYSLNDIAYVCLIQLTAHVVKKPLARQCSYPQSEEFAYRETACMQ